MRSHAKASTAGSTQRQAKGLGRFLRGSIHATAIFVALSLVAILLPAIPASAGTVTNERPLLFSFNGSDTTAGAFASIQRLGIDQASGDVYVMDRDRDVIDKLDSNGAAANFSATGTSSLGGNGTPQGSLGLNDEGDISIDNSGGATQGRIYINAENGPVSAFSPGGGYLWQLGAGLFQDDCGTAVDAAGHLWVGNYNSQEALEYDNTGSPPAQIGSVTSTTGHPCRLNLDSSGNLFFNIWNSNVDKYVGGAFDSTLDPTASQDVAIDQSSAGGHVFTIHNSDFEEYESSGVPIGTFGAEGGVIARGRGIAYNKALDRVYVADAGSNTVKVFGPIASGTVPDVTIETTTGAGISKAVFHGKINPQSVPNNYFFEWKEGTDDSWGGAKTTAPQSIEPTDSAEHPITFNATGLPGNATLQVRLVGVNTENNLRAVSAPDTFTTTQAASAPAVSIDTLGSVTATTAQISGTVNPREDAGTTWRLQTSTDPACASGFTNRPLNSLSSEAATAVTVAEELNGLLPNQHYCVQIEATNSFGSTVSETKEFTTNPVPPDEVETAFVAPLTNTSARLNARVNPEGASPIYPLTYRFEYSKDGGGTWIALPDREYTGGARKQLVVAEELTGLTPSTAYSYRFSAESDSGPASPQGTIKLFTTRSTAEATLPERGYELVNNPDKGNQNINSVEISETPRLSPDGNRALWSVLAGAPGSPNGVYGQFLSERTASGWKSRSLVPPAALQVGGGGLSYKVAASNSDLSQFVAKLQEPALLPPPEATLTHLDAQQVEDALGTYEWSGGEELGGVDLTDDGTHVLTVSPNSKQLEDIGSGSPEVISLMPDGTPSSCGLNSAKEPSFIGPGAHGSTQWHQGYHEMAIADASLVYFKAKPNGDCSQPWGLYVRNRKAEETILVDPGTGGENKTEFVRATPDGHQAYFVTFSQLDPADINSDMDLYRWDLDSEESSCLTCMVPDAQIEETNGGRTPVMVSDDFSHVYFQSTRRLIPGQGVAGGQNIYTVHDGSIRYVATVEFGDHTALGGQYGKLSADGNVLLFKSQPSPGLTADTVTAGSEQLYRYDDRDGSLECITCAHGDVTTEPVGQGAFGFGAYDLSTDGSTVVFVTAQALVPLDVNHGFDVYEWRGGSRGLVTDGITDAQEGFAQPLIHGIDADGSDVLFAVAEPGLTGFEQDGLQNLYDARVGGGFERPSPAVHCDGDSCQGSFQAPPDPGRSASSTFDGRGNVQGKARKRRPCAKQRGKAKQRCVRRHKSEAHKARAHRNAGRAK